MISLISKNTLIPKIFHYSWKDSALPFNFDANIKTWKKLHKTWAFKFWSDIDNRNFLAKFYPWALYFYDNFPHKICKVDFVRYFYLYHFGGIYVDLDFICLKNFNTLLKDKSDIILGRMGEDENFVHSIPNAIMCSKKNASFWMYLISMIIERFNNIKKLSKVRPEYLTGPVLLRDCIESYNYSVVSITNYKKSNIKILSKDYFYPINWNVESGKKEMLKVNKLLPATESLDRFIEMYPNSYAFTYWSHSWE